ncbi:unnamed protein product, partial [Amoebophrya sp. A25]
QNSPVEGEVVELPVEEARTSSQGIPAPKRPGLVLRTTELPSAHGRQVEASSSSPGDRRQDARTTEPDALPKEVSEDFITRGKKEGTPNKIPTKK